MQSSGARTAFLLMLLLVPSLAFSQSGLDHGTSGSQNGGQASKEDAVSKKAEIVAALEADLKTMNPSGDLNNFTGAKKTEYFLKQEALKQLKSSQVKPASITVASSVKNGTKEVKMDDVNNVLVTDPIKTATAAPSNSDSARDFQPVSSLDSSADARAATPVAVKADVVGNVPNISQDAKNKINSDENKMLAVATTIVSMNKSSGASTAGQGVKDASSGASADNNSSYSKTYSDVSSAAGGGSTSSASFSSYSPDMTAMWASMNRFNTNSYLSGASSYLGIAPGSFNLSANSVYSTIQSADNAAMFRQLAMSKLDSKGAADKLTDLATSDGFQDTLKTSLGEAGQNDFNLLAAGAAITNNSDLSPDSILKAQTYINSVLNSQKMINASPALQGLSVALGGNGLALLSPETLNWLKYASDLAYADLDKLPSQMHSRRALYAQGYEQLTKFLKNLALGDAVSLLNQLKVPVDLKANARSFEEAHQNFIKAHLEPLKYLKSQNPEGQQEQRLITFLEKLSKWVAGVSKADVGTLGKWSKLMGAEARGTVQIWEQVEPQSLTLARFFYAQMYYHAYVANSFSAKGNASPLIILVGDAQNWANYDAAKWLERKKLEKKREDEEKKVPTKKLREKFIDA